jgi:glycosyltransferase involved in cell wall biosynthesis
MKSYTGKFGRNIMNERIRVATIIQAFYPHVGGAERQLAALAPLLQARGANIFVLTRRYPGLRPFEMVNDVPVYRLPIPGPKAVKSMSFTLSAMPLLRRLRPDVIHAHELLSPTTTAVTAKRLFGTPVVTKVLRGGTLGDVYKLKNRRFGRSRLERFKQQVDAFIAISREIDTELAEVGIAAKKRTFIPNGVDTGRFTPLSTTEKMAKKRELVLPPGQHILFTGRLVPEKRIDQLITSWPAIRKVHANANLLVLGAGPEAARLEQLAGPGVHFLGQLDNVADFLQAADLFVLPSATEGLSNALLEAMASGLACIATRVGGATDVITHRQNGWLLQPDEPAQLQEAINTLLADVASRTRLGEQARLKMLREYALPMVADRLLLLYRSLLMDRPYIN